MCRPATCASGHRQVNCKPYLPGSRQRPGTVALISLFEIIFIFHKVCILVILCTFLLGAPTLVQKAKLHKLIFIGCLLNQVLSLLFAFFLYVCFTDKGT